MSHRCDQCYRIVRNEAAIYRHRGLADNYTRIRGNEIIQMRRYVNIYASYNLAGLAVRTWRISIIRFKRLSASR